MLGVWCFVLGSRRTSVHNVIVHLRIRGQSAHKSGQELGRWLRGGGGWWYQHEQVVELDPGGEARESGAVQRAAALRVPEHDLGNESGGGRVGQGGERLRREQAAVTSCGRMRWRLGAELMLRTASNATPLQDVTIYHCGKEA